jgi:hypothetical protein
VIEQLDNNERERRERFIIDDCDGIHPPVVPFYILSVEYSAQAAVAAFMRFEEAIDAGDDARAVAQVHDALAHCAALSRFFWPPKRSRPSATELARARGQRLRKLFHLEDGSPLRDRNLRNALEHFDERLDDFLIQNDVGYFMPQAMVDSHEIADDPLAKIFKLVDPEKHIFVILNEKFAFAELSREAARILMLADEIR